MRFTSREGRRLADELPQTESASPVRCTPMRSQFCTGSGQVRASRFLTKRARRASRVSRYLLEGKVLEAPGIERERGI